MATNNLDRTIDDIRFSLEFVMALEKSLSKIVLAKDTAHPNEMFWRLYAGKVKSRLIDAGKHLKQSQGV